MFEPFIWMFKLSNFKIHFLKLIIVSVILSLQAVILYYPMMKLFSTANSFFTYALYTIIAIFVCCSPILFLQGYFWELSSQIIDRSSDITSTSIYANKVREINKIELPEWNVKRYIWRGFASIVATIIMLVPWATIIYFSISRDTHSINLIPSDINPAVSIPLAAFIFLFYLLVPGLLWNYAKTDSIMAPLNIQKSIYLFGNYTGRYLINIIIIFVVFTADMLLTFLLDSVFGLTQLITNYTALNSIVLPILLTIIFSAIVLIKWIYLVHVYAYLIGTITPVGRE